MESLGWVVENTGGANIFIRHFPLLSKWSVIKVQRPDNLDFEKLDEIAKKHHALFVKVEPANEGHSVLDPESRYYIDSSIRWNDMGKYGFKKDSWPLLPSKTLILDLKKTTFESLSKDTRYEIRKSLSLLASQGVAFGARKDHLFKMSVEKSDDIELFYKVLKETMKIGKWDVPIHTEVINLWKSFQLGNSQLLFVYSRHSGERSDSRIAKRSAKKDLPAGKAGILDAARMTNAPVAGCLLIWDGDTTHYMYAALNKEGRQLGAAYFLMWEAIKFCQNKKMKFLDLEGIYDERYAKLTKNWKGFTKFKMGWGGKVIEYEGAFTKYFNPITKVLFLIGELV